MKGTQMPKKPNQAAPKKSKSVTLKELRVSLGRTVKEVEKDTFAVSGWVSEAEKPRDHRLSTIKSYIQALGGELELFVRFGKKKRLQLDI
jgi:hypothetical protein